MYLAQDDVCLQVQIHDSFIDAAKSHGLKAGTCADNGWTVQGKSFQKTVEYKGIDHTLDVTQYSHGGLMNLCYRQDCNQMKIAIVLI